MSNGRREPSRIYGYVVDHAVDEEEAHILLRFPHLEEEAYFFVPFVRPEEFSRLTDDARAVFTLPEYHYTFDRRRRVVPLFEKGPEDYLFVNHYGYHSVDFFTYATPSSQRRKHLFGFQARLLQERMQRLVDEEGGFLITNLH